MVGVGVTVRVDVAVGVLVAVGVSVLVAVGVDKTGMPLTVSVKLPVALALYVVASIMYSPASRVREIIELRFPCPMSSLYCTTSPLVPAPSSNSR